MQSARSTPGPSQPGACEGGGTSLWYCGTLPYSSEDCHPAAASKSLERSRRALGTEYVDIFLLYDQEPVSVRSEDVRSCLEDICNAGLIGMRGIVGDVAPSLLIASGFAVDVPVLKVRNDIWLRSPRRTPLFVASSSAFVTEQANPMFMIVAFAVRLADRLQKVLPSLSNAGLANRSYS